MLFVFGFLFAICFKKIVRKWHRIIRLMIDIPLSDSDPESDSSSESFRFDFFSTE